MWVGYDSSTRGLGAAAASTPLRPSEEGGVSDPAAKEAPVLAGLGAAAVQGLVALGPRAGTQVPRHGDAPEETDPLTPGLCHAQLRGFDLHAGIGTRAGQRDRLERLCRYALRSPMAQDRLRL